MLKIYLGPIRDDCIINVSHYFDTHKKRDWFNDDWVRKVIKDIDNVTAVR